jgi:hypothetical protein
MNTTQPAFTNWIDQYYYTQIVQSKTRIAACRGRATLTVLESALAEFRSRHAAARPGIELGV